MAKAFATVIPLNKSEVLFLLDAEVETGGARKLMANLDHNHVYCPPTVCPLCHCHCCHRHLNGMLCLARKLATSHGITATSKGLVGLRMDVSKNDLLSTFDQSSLILAGYPSNIDFQSSYINAPHGFLLPLHISTAGALVVVTV